MVYGVKNPNGRGRTLDENKLLILAIRANLKRAVKKLEIDEPTINWRSIEDEVADDLHNRIKEDKDV